VKEEGGEGGGGADGMVMRLAVEACSGRASSSVCWGKKLDDGVGRGGRGRRGGGGQRSGGEAGRRVTEEVVLLPLPGRGGAGRGGGEKLVAERGGRRGGGRAMSEERGTRDSRWLAEGWARGAQALDAAVDVAVDVLPEDVDRSVVEIAVRGGVAAAALNATAAVLASAAGVGTAIVGGTVLASELTRQGAAADASVTTVSQLAHAVAGLARSAGGGAGATSRTKRGRRARRRG